MSTFNLKEWISSPDITTRVSAAHKELLLTNEGIITSVGEALTYLAGVLDGERSNT